ncbi:MAG: DUF885 domain-containing protein [Chloroflexi bacterium]|nr:DUF885 domain-containing protein [Chloroflexota bacterium]
MHYEEPVRTFLQIALALDSAVERRTGTAPLLSRETYSYGFDTPSWSWAEIGRRIDDVRAALSGLPPARAAFISDLLAAFAVMVREGLGEAVPYAQRVEAFLQAPGRRVPGETIEQLAGELRRLLAEAGYPDDLAQAIPRWRAEQSVSGDEADRMAQGFLARAQQETQRRIAPLPEGHQVALTFPRNYPYHGYSYYSRNYQGRVFLNGDIDWQIPALKHTVCHEAFPGHQTYSALREYVFRQGRLPVEGTLYFSNTPITPLVEGMCEVGQEALGMVETVHDQIYETYNRYTSAVSTNLAFDCNEGLMDKETAVTLLMEAACISRVFAEKRYHFWTHPLWCTGFPHYWYGREFMRESYRRMQGHHPAFFQMVYGQPHTVRSLREAMDAYLAAPA